MELMKRPLLYETLPEHDRGNNTGSRITLIHTHAAYD